MWHAMRSEISDYFKFFFFLTIEFNLHFSEKGYLFVRWSDGKLILKILGFSDLVI